MARVGSFLHERIVAVVDIGDAYAGCAIISIPSKGPGRILGFARSKLSLEERTVEQSGARIAEEIAEAIKGARAVAAATKSGLHVPTVFAVLHAPWTSSKFFSSGSVYENDTVIHEAELSKIAGEALKKGEVVDRARALETSVVSIRLNGYQTRQPEGKHARSVDVLAISSDFESSVKGNAESAIQGAFPSSRIIWRSAARVEADVLAGIPEAQDSLVVNVGISATEFLVTRDGLPVVARSAKEGLRSLLSHIHMTRPADETLGLFRMLARDACADDACAALQSSLALAEPELAKIFGEHLSALAQERRLPNTLVLVAHPDVTSWLDNFFERIDFTQFTLTALPFSVLKLKPETFEKWIFLNNDMDTALLMASAHAVIDQQST